MTQRPIGERVMRVETLLKGFLIAYERDKEDTASWRKNIDAHLTQLNGVDSKLANHGLHADTAARNRLIFAVARALFGWKAASVYFIGAVVASFF